MTGIFFLNFASGKPLNNTLVLKVESIKPKRKLEKVLQFLLPYDLYTKKVSEKISWQKQVMAKKVPFDYLIQLVIIAQSKMLSQS